MPKPIKHWNEDNVLLFSILAGIGTWVLDAVIDSQLISGEGFFNSLVLEVTPHEVYFRLFSMIIIVLFGIFAQRTLAKREHAEAELRTALAAIEDEKAKSEAIIAAIPDGISIQDRDYRIRYQNKVHRDLVGDQLGKTCYEAYSKRDSICPGCPVALSYVDGGHHVLEQRRARHVADLLRDNFWRFCGR